MIAETLRLPPNWLAEVVSLPVVSNDGSDAIGTNEFGSAKQVADRWRWAQFPLAGRSLQ